GQVVFVNGSFNASAFDGVFDNNFGLQATTDGTTWAAVSGWTLSPAYAYNSASAGGATYTFTGPALSVLGVRVVGQVHSKTGNDSSAGNAAEGHAVAPAPGGSAPAAPSGLTAVAASTSQINLSWTDNSTNETGFLVERSTDGTTFTQVASL